MDTFIEQIIKKQFGTKDYLLFAAAIVAGCAVILISMTFLQSVALLVLIAVCVGVYFLVSSRNLEYEYSVTNGDITIDKIINRSRRKRVVSIDAHDVESIGKYNPEEHSQKSYDSRIFASENDSGKDAWYFAGHSAKKGNVLVVFNPNEKVLSAIKPFLSRQVSINAFGRN
jgi:hypothetical protein